MNRESILAAHPLTAFIESQGATLSANGTRANRCPKKHHERADTVAIDATAGTWFCHACNVGGSVIDWHAIKRGITTAEAMRELAGTNGNGSNGTGLGRVIRTHTYTDADGNAVYQVRRHEPKTFRPYRADGKGGWIIGLGDVRRVLYHLPAVLAAETVWITEGERDADTLTALGITATTNVGGAEKWTADYSDTLAGKSVVICGDTDEPGKRHVEQVGRSLQGRAASVRVVSLPSGKDVSEYLATVAEADRADAVADLERNATPWATAATPLQSAAKAADSKLSKMLSLPAPSGDIKSDVVAILTDGNLSPGQRNDAVAGAVVSALVKRGRFYYHTQHRDFSTAMFFDGETKRLERIQSDAFLAWLSSWTAINRTSNVFKFCQSAIETAALSGDHTTGILPEAYFAARPGALYVSNGDGHLVRITPDRFELADNGTDGVLFPAGATLPTWDLVEPRDPFRTCAVFRDANYGATHGQTLLKLFLCSIPTVPACRPAFVFVGVIRSGKTKVVREICRLFGLPAIIEEPADNEKSETAFWVNADAGGLYCLDNADTKTAWLADAIASASTGAGKYARKLYTDRDRVELRPRAWVALTSANPTFAGDAGLADRVGVIRLTQRTGSTNDETLAAEVQANRNASLSWIVHALAGALGDTAPTPDGLNLRHPDFGAFAVRIGRALGIEADAVAALRAAEADKSRFCLENDPVGAALLAMIAAQESFTGTAADLLERLAVYDADFSAATTGARGNRLWTSKRLGKRLATIWPFLAELAHAKTEKDRLGFTIYVLKPRTAEFAEFNSLKHIKPPRENYMGTLPESVKETLHTLQPTAATVDGRVADLLPPERETAQWRRDAARLNQPNRPAF